MALSGFFGCIVIYFARDGTVAMPQNAIEIRVQSAVHLWHASLRVPYDFIPGRKARYGCLLALCGVVGVSA